MMEQETINEQEVKQPVIGEFKPKRAFLNFVSAVNGARIRFIRDIAFVKGEKLSGTLEGVVFKITICDEGTINFEEVDTNVTDAAQRKRLLDDIDSMEITGYAQKFVVAGIQFADVNGDLCYLEVENKNHNYENNHFFRFTGFKNQLIFFKIGFDFKIRPQTIL